MGATGKNNTLGWTGYDIVIVFAVAVAVIVVICSQRRHKGGKAYILSIEY